MCAIDGTKSESAGELHICPMLSIGSIKILARNDRPLDCS